MNGQIAGQSSRVASRICMTGMLARARRPGKRRPSGLVLFA
ncbi:MAG TPA: hypothetical protein VNO33_11900 [Kofleriaceae bacterium]|nr:hypothetical protein [Kofleriaceae bacterium]